MGNELLKSNTQSTNKNKKKEKENLPYIDLIAIIQDLDMKEDESNE